MFRGYPGNSSLTGTRLEDGWFYTGDIGYLDKHRRIYLCGRSDDMFLFNSMNIYPQEIESQICQYPHVIDAAVLPRKSSAHGNIPVALVVFDQDVKPDQPSPRNRITIKLDKLAALLAPR
ncbi:MAG: AMP-binding protein [Gammaproteobacteria bacterium]|nr:AMP-binding protein [Gammaproteobacteria bacterium]